MTPDPKYKPLMDAMQEFVDRCDKGEIRSKYTYAKFKEVLKGVEDTTSRNTPSSKELISLAERDWHNREERKHKHPMSPWVSGWITGFLTPTKPDWNKEREKKVHEKVLDEYYIELKKELGKGMDYIDWDSIEAVYIRMCEKK